MFPEGIPNNHSTNPKDIMAHVRQLQSQSHQTTAALMGISRRLNALEVAMNMKGGSRRSLRKNRKSRRKSRRNTR